MHGREVVVQPNPRVHKALKTQMTAILAELERIAAGDNVPDELLSTIDLIAVTMQGLKGEDANGGNRRKDCPCNICWHR